MKRVYETMAKDYWKRVYQEMAKGKEVIEIIKASIREEIIKEKHLQEITHKGENEIARFDEAIAKIEKETEEKRYKKKLNSLVENAFGC